MAAALIFIFGGLIWQSIHALDVELNTQIESCGV